MQKAEEIRRSMPFRGTELAAREVVPNRRAVEDACEWFVVRTKPRKEECAVRNLIRRRVEVFFPRILEPVGWGNDWTTVPLFPGYLFVQIVLHSAYHSVIWTPGVKSFVSFGEIPTPVQAGIVNFLRHEGGEDGVIRPAPRFHAGDMVRIKRGPFAGLMGIIEKPCPERGRIRVLMDFLRRGTSVELPVTAVGRA
jgi:transcriptional antiterminator RfaH